MEEKKKGEMEEEGRKRAEEKEERGEEKLLSAFMSHPS